MMRPTRMASLLLLAACGATPAEAPTSPDGSIDGGECAAAFPSCACDGRAQSGRIAVAAEVSKLVSDPTRCALYALAGDELIVIDIGGAVVARRIDLPGYGTDVDISPNGAQLVVGHGAANRITVFDPANFDAAAVMLSTWRDVEKVEVTATAQVFYATKDQFVEVHRVDIETGTDIAVDPNNESEVDLDLSADDAFLFIGNSGSSSSSLFAYGVRDGAFGIVDGTPQPDYHASMDRHVYVSPSGRVYYADRRFDGSDLEAPPWNLAEKVLAETVDGGLLAGVAHLRDANTQEVLSMHPAPLSAAAFTADAELWFHEASSNEVGWIRVR